MKYLYLVGACLIFLSIQEVKTTKTVLEKRPLKPLIKYLIIEVVNSNEKIVLKELKNQGFTDSAAAAVMGVVGGESNFQNLKEKGYQNTSNSRIRAIFPSRLGSMSDSQLNSLKSNYTYFFNAVYGGLYGNGVNEGAFYVGRGFNGITFKSNYQAASNATGIDFVSNPELLENPKFAAKALAAYFQNEKDIKDFEKAFQEAYRRNAGYGNSFAYYDNSTNPAHAQGVPLKREKGKEYLQQIKGSGNGFFLPSFLQELLLSCYGDGIEILKSNDSERPETIIILTKKPLI